MKNGKKARHIFGENPLELFKEILWQLEANALIFIRKSFRKVKSFVQEAMETSHEETQDFISEEENSNDLKEFGVDSDSPDLFSSESENSSPEDLLSSNEEEEDDLEIPAFLRRQKN